MRQPKLITFFLLLSLLLLAPNLAGAEWFTDLYAGIVWTDQGNIDQKSPDFDLGLPDETDFDQFWVIGYRVGYWFENFPYVGLAIDASYFQAYPDSAILGSEDPDLWVIPISPMLMLRMPLNRSSEFPKGKVQLYGGAGPGIFFSDYEEGDFSDSSVDIGLDSRAGVAYMFHTNWAALFELRYTSFEPKYDNHFNGERVEFEVEIDTFHGMLGFSYRF